MPNTLREIARFWGFSELEALFRAGYIREFLGDIAGLVRSVRSGQQVGEPVDRSRDIALQMLVGFFPLRGEIPKFAGPVQHDREKVAAWVGHFARDAARLVEVSKIGGKRPLLLDRACEVLYDKSPAAAAIAPETRDFIAAEYVRAYVLGEFGDEAKRFVASAYRMGSDIRTPRTRR